MTDQILVVAAHPDDEVLGCGGTLAKHVDSGDDVSILFLSDGETSRTSSDILLRQEMARNACLKLQVSELDFLSFPDNQMDQVPLLNIAKEIERKIATVKPSIVYTHWVGDLNVDHRICHQAVHTACRPQPGCCVKKILCFEVRSSTEWGLMSEPLFAPNYHSDIEGYLSVKLVALSEYHSEMRAFPHTRSIEAIDALARHRGSAVGLEAAEAFVLTRAIA